jgi:hypothetical protein
MTEHGSDDLLGCVRYVALLTLQILSYVALVVAQNVWRCNPATDYVAFAVLAGVPAAWIISEHKTLGWVLIPVILVHLLVSLATIVYLGMQCISWPK